MVFKMKRFLLIISGNKRENSKRKIEKGKRGTGSWEINLIERSVC